MRRQHGQAGVLVAVVVLIAVVVVSIGGWQLYWWVKNQSVNKNAVIYQNGYGAQSAYIEEMSRDIAGIAKVDVQIAAPQTPADEKAALQSQRAAMVTQACDIAAKITVTVPQNIATFESKECQ